MEMEGRGALITGASRGLGAAIARELAARGAKVVLVARHDADAIADELRRDGGEAYAIAADLSRKDDIHKIAGQAAALAGDLDVLVHNASALGPTPLPLLLDTSCEALEEVLATNVLGPFRLGKAIVGPMLLRGRGVVVHVSSDAAVEAYPRWGAYGASKAAFDHLSRIWAAELAGSGVRLFGVDPGEMDTAMHAAALPEADRGKLARPADVARKLVHAIVEETIAHGARVTL